MSNTLPSRLATATRRPPTLSEVLEWIGRDECLSATRRRDLSSALRTMGRALNRELEDIPADPRFLRACLK